MERQGAMSIGIDSCGANFNVNMYNRPSSSRSENMQVISDRINKLLEKLENGDIEPSYQIGGRSFTEREWNKLIDEFDDAEDTLKKLLEEERERLLRADEIKRIEQKEIIDKQEDKEIEKKEIADHEKINEEDMELLTTDSVSCTYTDDNCEVKYVIAYGPDGIKCKRLGYIGEEGYLWEIPFRNASEQRKVIDFLEKFPMGANLVFASDKDFWEDFLDGKINEDDYLRNF